MNQQLRHYQLCTCFVKSLCMRHKRLREVISTPTLIISYRAKTSAITPPFITPVPVITSADPSTIFTYMRYNINMHLSWRPFWSLVNSNARCILLRNFLWLQTECRIQSGTTTHDGVSSSKGNRQYVASHQTSIQMEQLHHENFQIRATNCVKVVHSCRQRFSC